MATIERRQRGRGAPVRWRVRWRDALGRQCNKTFERAEDARRFKVRLDGDLTAGTWIDPSLARVSVGAWTGEWRRSVVDLRPTSLARLDSTLANQVLPEWGPVALSGVTNADVRAWAARLHAEGLSASSVRKAVFGLRRILAAAVADRRLAHNAAEHVPLPVEEPGEQRFLTADEVDALASAIAPRFRALVLVAAYGGLRLGELSALRRRRIDLLRGRVLVAETIVEVAGRVHGPGPTKTRKGRRTVPLPRSTVREVAGHLSAFVGESADALLFCARDGGPLSRGPFRRDVWMPAVRAAGLEGLRVHDMRHTYVSLLIRAGANPKEVSTWAGHSSVAFTLDRYGHLYDDADETVADRLDALLHGTPPVKDAQVIEWPKPDEASG